MLTKKEVTGLATDFEAGSIEDAVVLTVTVEVEVVTIASTA